MKPRAILTTDKNWTQGVHAKCIHLHFDINGDRVEIEKHLADYLDKYAEFLEWDDFFLPTVEELENTYADSLYSPSRETRQMLCDPEKYGAPQAHLSARHLHGNICHTVATEEFDLQKLMRIYTEGCELLKDSPFCGYVEVEDALQEEILHASKKNLSDMSVSPISNVPLKKLDLHLLHETEASNTLPFHYRESCRRWFRTTEIHISFDDISQVNPQVILRFLEFGFYSAFKRQKNRGIKFIATIQGFEHEISKLRELTISYLSRPDIQSAISCKVTLKKEDILAFLCFGNDPSMQKVVLPGSLS